VDLLERIIRFLFDNIGNIVSPKKIANSLTSMGTKTSPITVENYIEALTDAYFLYKATRYDVKGKQHLKSLEKYYLVDMGLRRLLLGNPDHNIGYILENIVYLELRYRGYTVNIGKIDDLEIDFIAQSGAKKIYYQVAASTLDPATLERETAPLMKIKDAYPKYILTMDDLPIDINGIRQINIIKFLLEK
jgi:predicted AAA+ superfamily ATPase